jgi:hypothetical protein
MKEWRYFGRKGKGNGAGGSSNEKGGVWDIEEWAFSFEKYVA